MAVDLNAIEALPEGAREFFLIFTRCEFALKDCGLFLWEHNQVKADWATFATRGGWRTVPCLRKAIGRRGYAAS